MLLPVSLQARVNKIVVKGINKTKDEFLQKKLQTIFKAENVLQVIYIYSLSSSGNSCLTNLVLQVIDF